MPAATFKACYDFETALPAGFKALLQAEEIKPVLVPADGPKFRQERPRIELYFNAGGETGHHAPTLPHYRADAFAGSLLITIISNTKPADVGTAEHMDYVSAVRDLMARARTLFKADRDAADAAGYLPYHAVHDIVHTGSNTDYEGQDGYYQTDLNYDLKFSIRPDAWPAEA
jgi:hypothetical protein